MADYTAALRPGDGGTRISVRVVPRASRTQVAGLHGDALKVRLQAPPVEGKANAVLLAYLAEVLGVGRADLTLLGGDRSRSKVVAVAGLEPAQVAARLSSL